MITDILDVANELLYALRKELPPDQVQSGGARCTVFANIHPETAVFTLDTVEGKTFRVTITQEKP
jgi:hypothetical protein